MMSVLSLYSLPVTRSRDKDPVQSGQEEPNSCQAAPGQSMNQAKASSDLLQPLQSFEKTDRITIRTLLV